MVVPARDMGGVFVVYVNYDRVVVVCHGKSTIDVHACAVVFFCASVC